MSNCYMRDDVEVATTINDNLARVPITFNVCVKDTGVLPIL